jgi:hypothetical protein
MLNYISYICPSANTIGNNKELLVCVDCILTSLRNLLRVGHHARAISEMMPCRLAL